MARRSKQSNAELIANWLAFYALPKLIGWLWRLVSRPSEAARTKEKRRRNPPGYHKARAQAMEANVDYYGMMTCEICYRTKIQGVQSFEVHHIKSWKRHTELRADPENLAVTCFSCNRGMSDDHQSLDFRRCKRKSA